MNKSALSPDVTVKIAGQSHQIRWDKAALYELGMFPEAGAEIDENNGAMLFRRACIFAFCMLRSKHSFGSPKDIAAAIADDETEALMDGVVKAMQAGTGGKDGTDDPLSRSGPLPDAG